MAITTMSSASRIPPVVSSGVSMASSRTRRSRSDSYRRSIETSERRRRKSLDRVARSRRTEQVAGDEGMVHDGHAGHPLHAIAWPAVEAARRNVELKARDPDPAATLARALAAGAEDRGVLHQRDTYFAVAHGRLKLREEEPGGATLIAYDRPDAGADRVSAYRLVPVPDPAALRAALAGACGVRAEVAKRRRLLMWETVRIHLDEVAGLGSFLELEAVAAAGSDLERERAQVEHLRGALAIRDDGADRGLLRRRGRADGPAAAAAPRRAARRRRARPELLAMARAAAATRMRPYSRFPVGAAVRTTDGRRYAGANVENAAFPQGQCAEASALGAMVAGGGGTVAEVVVAAPSRELCTPCGGCRQRLREFTPPDAPIHLADEQSVRRTTSLAELLPLSFGPGHLSASRPDQNPAP